MKKVLVSMLLAVSMLTACAVVPGGRGYGPEGGIIVPLLPPLVVLDVEPFYYYGGFHYHYLDDRWYYSRSRSGPWFDLPRDHYPREVRFKGRDHGRDRDRDRDHDGRDRYRPY